MSAQPIQQPKPAKPDLRVSAEASLRSALEQLQRSRRVEVDQLGPAPSSAGASQDSPVLRAMGKRLAAAGLSVVAFNAVAQPDASADVNSQSRLNRHFEQVFNTDLSNRATPFARAMTLLGLDPTSTSRVQRRMADEVVQVSGRKLFLADTNDILSMRTAVNRASQAFEPEHRDLARALLTDRMLSNFMGSTQTFADKGSLDSSAQAYCLVGAPLNGDMLDPVIKNIVLAHELGHCATTEMPFSDDQAHKNEVMADVYSALIYLRDQRTLDPASFNKGSILAILKDVRDTRLVNSFSAMPDPLHDTSRALDAVMDRYGTVDGVRALQAMKPADLVAISRSIASEPGMSMTTADMQRMQGVLSKMREFGHSLEAARANAQLAADGIRVSVTDRSIENRFVLFTEDEQRQAASLANRLEDAVRRTPALSRVGSMKTEEAVHSLRVAATTGMLPLKQESAIKIMSMTEDDVEALREKAEMTSEPYDVLLEEDDEAIRYGRSMSPG